MTTRAGRVLAFGLSLVIILIASPGCPGGGGSAASPDAPAAPAAPAASAAGSLAGRWTRELQDGEGDPLVYEVEDDGETVTGRLLGADERGFESYTFELTRRSEGATVTLEGSARLVLVEDPDHPLVTRWELTAQPGGAIAGRVEWADVDEDGTILERGWEERAFTLER